MPAGKLAMGRLQFIDREKAVLVRVDGVEVLRQPRRAGDFRTREHAVAVGVPAGMSQWYCPELETP